MPSELHATLRKAAREAGTSLNDHCLRKLVLPDRSVPEAAAVVVQRANAIAGSNLVGVMVFGSWARGGATESSDVDVLIVVDSDRQITRDLYREWDMTPLRWEDRAVEPHFVRLPEADDRVSGLWAEVAIDGMVLFERDFYLSRRLAALRGRIAAGDVVRRWSNGHPYWIAA